MMMHGKNTIEMFYPTSSLIMVYYEFFSLASKTASCRGMTGLQGGECPPQLPKMMLLLLRCFHQTHLNERESNYNFP